MARYATLVNLYRKPTHTDFLLVSLPTAYYIFHEPSRTRVVSYLTRDKLEARVLVNELELSRPAACHLAPRLGVRPKPRRVNMTMT